MDIGTALVEENKNMIYKIAHFYGNYNSIEDLFQEGFVGLMKAYKKYDDSYGTKFSTYAYDYICGEIIKHIRKSKGINISREITKLNLKIEKASILLTQKLMREPSVKEISDFLEIPEYLIVEALKSSAPIESTDRVISEDGKEITIEDTIAAPSKDIDELIMLRDELSKLSEEEKQIIEKRYNQDLTQAETAKLLGMTQVKVSRYENKILKKLNQRLTI